MNLHLPSVKTDASLPTKGDGAGTAVFSGYTELPFAERRIGGRSWFKNTTLYWSGAQT